MGLGSTIRIPIENKWTFALLLLTGILFLEKNLLKQFLLLTVLLSVSCNTLKYKTTSETKLPELGAIGYSQNYLLNKQFQSKTTVSITDPIRVIAKEITISDRKLFTPKNNSEKKVTDSTLVSFEIFDKVALIKQINQDPELLAFLRKSETDHIVTASTHSVDALILKIIDSADELYLIQNKQKTLSLELRKNNKPFETIEFSNGIITSYKVSEFCWGLNKRRDPQVFDLVESGTGCGENLYKSAQKAEKKNEFKF